MGNVWRWREEVPYSKDSVRTISFSFRLYIAELIKISRKKASKAAFTCAEEGTYVAL